VKLRAELDADDTPEWEFRGQQQGASFAGAEVHEVEFFEWNSKATNHSSKHPDGRRLVPNAVFDVFAGNAQVIDFDDLCRFNSVDVIPQPAANSTRRFQQRETKCANDSPALQRPLDLCY